MEITQKINGTAAEIAVSGWLDTRTAPELQEALEALGPEIESLTLDLAGLEYISSMGLRLLLTASKKMGENFTICHVAAEVMDVLKMTSFDKILHIED